MLRLVELELHGCGEGHVADTGASFNVYTIDDDTADEIEYEVRGMVLLFYNIDHIKLPSA